MKSQFTHQSGYDGDIWTLRINRKDLVGWPRWKIEMLQSSLCALAELFAPVDDT